MIEGQRHVYVTSHDNKVYKAKVLLSSPENDIGVLEVDDTGAEFPYLELGDSSAIDIAEPVIAIGNPFGFTFTVTSGIISALDRTFGAGVEGLIQTDAPINPGNSGGPLVNMKGEVIGVSHAILSPARRGEQAFVGLGFAVPVNRVKELLAAKPSQGGKAYLGITLDVNSQGYAQITRVADKSPAQEAGLQKGDIILSIDGRKIPGLQEIISYIASKNAGDEISMEITRGAKNFLITLLLGSQV